MGEKTYRGAIGWLAVYGLLAGPAQAAGVDVDVAIVFAVDNSSSIDRHTADLQREGHAKALLSPDVVAAITETNTGCIAITYFEWSSVGRTRIVLPWTRICSGAAADAAARVISGKGDRGYGRGAGGRTSVSAAIDVSALLLDRYPESAARKVIDISSNGENNDGLPVLASRELAVAKGYTINAIAVPSADENPVYRLASYFTTNVIGGPGAFVITPAGPDDYAIALRRKLVLEIAATTPGTAVAGRDGLPVSRYAVHRLGSFWKGTESGVHTVALNPGRRFQ